SRCGRTVSAEPEFDAVRPPRITPVDRVLAEMLADDRACTEFDATLRVVHEFLFLEAIHLGRAHVQARLRVAGAAHVGVDGDERFFVEFEPIEADAIVYRQGLRRVRFRGFRHPVVVERWGRVIKGWESPDEPIITGGNQEETSIGYGRHRRGPPHFVDGTVPTYARPRPDSFHDRLDRGPFRPQSPRGEGVPRGRLGGQRENRRPSPVECALAHRPAGGDREYPEAARVDDWRVVEGHPVSLRRTECPGGDESLGVDPVDAGAPDAGERSTSHGRIGAPRVGTV